MTSRVRGWAAVGGFTEDTAAGNYYTGVNQNDVPLGSGTMSVLYVAHCLRPMIGSPTVHSIGHENQHTRGWNWRASTGSMQFRAPDGAGFGITVGRPMTGEPGATYLFSGVVDQSVPEVRVHVTGHGQNANPQNVAGYTNGALFPLRFGNNPNTENEPDTYFAYLAFLASNTLALSNAQILNTVEPWLVDAIQQGRTLADCPLLSAQADFIYYDSRDAVLGPEDCAATWSPRSATGVNLTRNGAPQGFHVHPRFPGYY